MDEKELREIDRFAHDICLQSIKLSCKSCVKCDFGKTCIYRRLAERLYKNRNYRKIPDGVVVLNIGKNNEALDEKTIEFFVKHNAEVRKETAREIIKFLRSAECPASYAAVDIADMFNVEIEE